MILGMTRGEIVLVGIIFGLIYMSGLLPRIVARLAGKEGEEAGAPGPEGE